MEGSLKINTAPTFFKVLSLRICPKISGEKGSLKQAWEKKKTNMLLSVLRTKPVVSSPFLALMMEI